VKGLSWTGFAISTAEWTGVRLRDVLQWAGACVRACVHVWDGWVVVGGARAQQEEAGRAFLSWSRSFYLTPFHINNNIV